jgi:hypothetical protein
MLNQSKFFLEEEKFCVMGKLFPCIYRAVRVA